MKILFNIWICFALLTTKAQVPISRLTDWTHAGNINNINNQRILDFDSLGGKAKSGFLNDTVIKKAIDILGKTKGGTIRFGPGRYNFKNTISLIDSITLKGQGTTTILEFDLNGATKNCIDIVGQINSKSYNILNCKRGSYQIFFNSKVLPNNHTLIQVFQNDSNLAFSNWSYGSIGQIFKTTLSDSNTSTLNVLTPFRLNIKSDVFTFVKILKPIQNVSVECLKIIRKDSTPTQTHNIRFKYAFNCLVKGVESENCNFGHIVFENSIHNTVSQCYIHHAFAYGGNGQGYGVVLQSTSSDNKIENSIFKHLRHSLLLQSGANGNVIGYNYSLDPYWTDNLIKDAAGDLVCHGNYTHHNLFEGNICQNIVVDNSHGKNGPYNTFFRNRAELYGLIVSENQDSQNFIANEIINTNALRGHFIIPGLGHLSSKNNVKNKFESNTSIIVGDTSYYLSSKPSFITPQTPWPILGYPQLYNKGLNGAKIRFNDSAEKIICGSINYPSKLEINNLKNDLYSCYPNPFNNRILIEITVPTNMKLYDGMGHLIMDEFLKADTEIDTSILKDGLYFLMLNNSETLKLIKLSDHCN